MKKVLEIVATVAVAALAAVLVFQFVISPMQQNQRRQESNSVSTVDKNTASVSAPSQDQTPIPAASQGATPTLTPTPSAAPTPAPTAEPAATPAPSIQNVVNLEGGLKTDLEENMLYGSVDLDGDGSEDQIDIQTQADEEGYEYSSQVLINGQVVRDFTPEIDEGSAISKTTSSILQLNTGDVYIYLCLELADDDDMQGEAIYKYQDGTLRQVVNLTPIDDSGFSFHDRVEDIDVRGNTIQFNVYMQPSSVAGIEMTRTLVGHDHTLEFLSHEADVMDYAQREENDAEYCPARVSIPCYKTGDSQPVQNTIAEGTMCKVTKAYFADGMELKRFFLETQDGRSGWFDQDLSTTDSNGSNVPIFYGHGFAG